LHLTSLHFPCGGVRWDLIFKGSLSYADYLKKKTGYPVAPGLHDFVKAIPEEVI